MSYPQNPKSDGIQQMLLRFCPIKEIRLSLRTSYNSIADQIERLGMKKRWITDEEERYLLSRRKTLGLIK
jgi:predicted transcriptional regulator